MKSTDLCLSSGGAEVVLATSSDEKYPPENIIDGDVMGGYYCPHFTDEELRYRNSKRKVAWAGAMQTFPGLTTLSMFVRSLRIEKSVSKDPVDFEECTEKDLQYTEGALQTEEFALPEFQATYLRFIIKSAFDHFVSVHTVMAEGVAENI